ncbi:hypothetical protein, partial [Serratia marcescens]|uniref:hypothetical protein n=1 Tax=Serratia marcescens TaxID=615 RepID=UPI001E626C22
SGKNGKTYRKILLCYRRCRSFFFGTQYETPGGITQFPRLLIFARMRKPSPQLSPFASGVAAYIP